MGKNSSEHVFAPELLCTLSASKLKLDYWEQQQSSYFSENHQSIWEIEQTISPSTMYPTHLPSIYQSSNGLLDNVS